MGVVINESGKSSEQCILAAKKANVILRPRLESSVQAWCPYLRQDIDMLERVQRRATKLIEGLKEELYSERLICTGLVSLEKRRVRGDLIQVFKMVKDENKSDFCKFFQLHNSNRTI